MHIAWGNACLKRIQCLILVCLSVFGSVCYAELKLHEVKAAYLFQISKFVSWPETVTSSSDAFHLCQLGQDVYHGVLEKMQGRSVFNKPIQVRQVMDLLEAQGCHLLVISAPHRIHRADLMAWLATHSTLIVADGANHLGLAMVAFVVEEQRVRLHINLELVERANLSLAANLLEVASYIHRGHD